MGDLTVAEAMNLDLPTPVGDTQKPDTNAAGAVALSRRPIEMTDGAWKIVVAIFVGPSVFFLLSFFFLTPPRRKFELYAMSFSTAGTELVAFQPLDGHSSSNAGLFSTPSLTYRSKPFPACPALCAKWPWSGSYPIMFADDTMHRFSESLQSYAVMRPFGVCTHHDVLRQHRPIAEGFRLCV